MKFLLLPSFLLLSFCAFAQFNQGEYEIGQGSGAYSIVQAKDGGYVMAGSIDGGDYVYVVKLNSNYSLKWTKMIGGGNYNEAYSLVETKDGGYAMAGYTEVYGAGGEDVYVVKLDSNGNLKWTRTIGGADDDWGNSITQTYDGGLVITGGTKSYGGGVPNFADVYIIKLDSAGNKLWTKTIEGPWGSDDEGYSIIQTKDSGLAIAGIGINGGAKVFVIRLDSTGNLKWAKSIGGPVSDYAYSLAQTYDGGFITTGYTLSYGTTGDVYIVKLDSVGNLKWTKTIGGTKGDEGESIIQTKDSGYVIVGGTNSFSSGGNSNIYVIRLDSAGNLIWANTFGGSGGDVGLSIVQIKNGGYAVAGYDSTFIFLKIDSSGNSCTKTGSGGIVGSGGTVTNGGSITSSNGGAIGSGGTVSSGGTENIICQSTSIENIPPHKETIELYPNPSNGQFTLSLSHAELVSASQTTVAIYNMFGTQVYNAALQPQTPKGALIDISSQPNGIYLYRVLSESGNLLGEGKVVIEK